jgi:hypothetical protein
MAVYSGICFLGVFHEKKILTPVIKKVVIV